MQLTSAPGKDSWRIICTLQPNHTHTRHLWLDSGPDRLSAQTLCCHRWHCRNGRDAGQGQDVGMTSSAQIESGDLGYKKATRRQIVLASVHPHCHPLSSIVIHPHPSSSILTFIDILTPRGPDTPAYPHPDLDSRLQPLPHPHPLPHPPGCPALEH